MDDEMKFLDTSIASDVDSTGEIMTSINLIPQGTDDNERIGRQCIIRSISMKGFINGNSTNTVGALVQYALVWDKQCNGANAAYTDIWETNAFNSMLNLANSQRFQVLKVFRLRHKPTVLVGATPTVIPDIINIEFDMKCNIPLEFSSTTGAITEIKSNNLAWYAISTSDDTVGLNTTTRIKFTDY